MGAIICADFIGIPCLPHVPTFLNTKNTFKVHSILSPRSQRSTGGDIQLLVGYLPLCVYVCVYSFVRACVVRVYVHAVSCWCVCAHACVHVCVCMHVFMHAVSCWCVCVCCVALVCVHACTRACVCKHVCMYIRLYAPLLEQSGCSLPTTTWTEVCMQHIHFQRPQQLTSALCFQVEI